MKAPIGKSSTGEILCLVLFPKKEDIPNLLTNYTVREQLEILCILEHNLVHSQNRGDNSHAYGDTFSLYFSILNSIRESGYFDFEVDKAKLQTSLDRVRLGMKLAM